MAWNHNKGEQNFAAYVTLSIGFYRFFDKFASIHFDRGMRRLKIDIVS